MKWENEGFLNSERSANNDGTGISCVSGKIFRDPEMYIHIVSYRVIQDSVTKNHRWQCGVGIWELSVWLVVQHNLRTILCSNLRKLVLTLKEYWTKVIFTANMALHVPKAPGVSQMLKEGARVSSGSSLGPHACSYYGCVTMMTGVILFLYNTSFCTWCEIK